MSPDNSKELEQLLIRCANRDGAAMHELYSQTSPQLFGLLRRILNRDDLAQEALQDVYISVWKNAGSYNHRKGAVFTWLVSIARYRAIDLKRSRRHEVFVDNPEQLIDNASELHASDSDPQNVATRDADSSLLNRCLNRLDLRQRSAVSMAYLRGLTHAEVAIQVDAPIGTVKSWIRRGLASLKECLQT